jgi:hypothetical protein
MNMKALSQAVSIWGILTAVSVVCLGQELRIPPEDAPVVEIAPIPNSLKNNSKTEQKIREALQGNAVQGTGDPLLDDVLQMIRKDGSILRGTQFDPQRLERELSVNSSHAPGVEHSESPSNAGDAEIRARAAEMLLRSARFLMQIGPVDEIRKATADQMRREAVRLLLE